MTRKESINLALKSESKAQRGAVVTGQAVAGAGFVYTLISFLRANDLAPWTVESDAMLVAMLTPPFAGLLHWAAKFLPASYAKGKGLTVLAVCGFSALALSGCGHEEAPTLTRLLTDFIQGELGGALLQLIITAMGI